jgi:hypothetical protein
MFCPFFQLGVVQKLSMGIIPNPSSKTYLAKLKNPAAISENVFLSKVQKTLNN